MWLNKAVEESWYPELEEGLDAFEEPPEEEENKMDTSEHDKKIQQAEKHAANENMEVTINAAS